jgi:aminopeptidase N
LPGAEFKRAAWDSLINAPQGKDLPNAIQSETTAGFNHVHDTTVLEPYVDEYFAMLRRIYAEKTNEMAANLIEGRDNVRRALAAQPVDALATWGEVTE